MTLIQLLASPWAIDPDKLAEIQAVYTTHLKGDKIDLQAVEQRIGRPLASDQQDYRVEAGGVGVLSIAGAIAPKANLFTQVSGGASAQMLERQVRSLRADTRVRSVLLDWDTPGGSVFGIPSLAGAIRELAEAKPTVSVSTGQMLSAGIWLSTAANAVFASGSTDQAGSIGVVATHTYNPRAPGAQVTEITAGRYKRAGSSNAPLSAEDRAYIQDQVDTLYSIFVDAVADQRGTTAADVLERMADGRVFVAGHAVEAGLIDGIASVEELLDRLATAPQDFAARRSAPVRIAMSPARRKPGPAMAAGADDAPQALAAADATAPTPADLPADPLSTPAAGAAAPPDAPVSHVAPTHRHKDPTMTPQEQAAAFAAEHADAAALLRAEGATTERERIQSVRAVAIPGHEALVERMAFDGSSTAAEAALAINQAARATLAAAAQSHFADAPPAAPGSVAPAPGAADPATQIAQAKAYAAQHGCDFVTAVKALGIAV